MSVSCCDTCSTSIARSCFGVGAGEGGACGVCDSCWRVTQNAGLGEHPFCICGGGWAIGVDRVMGAIGCMCGCEVTTIGDRG